MSFLRKTLYCDSCSCPLSPSAGYLLDVRKEYLEQKRRELAEFEEFAVKAGAASLTVERRPPVRLVCEDCLAKQGATQGMALDPVIKLMSWRRAAHFWETGEWERPMLAEDFPAESEEDRLPWMNAALEAEWKKHVGKEPSLEEYLVMRAATLCRFLSQGACHASVPNNPCAIKPRGFTVVIAELDPHANWEKFFLGFVERRLLNRVDASTRAWFVSYRDSASIWFTHRMVSYVAIGIAGALGQNATGLEFECYIDNQSRRCLSIVG